MKILFAGEGGQGVQVIAEILTKASLDENKHASYIPNFGVEQRGGISLAFVIIDDKPVVYPKFEKADILAILSERALERIKQFQNEKTRTIKGPALKDGLKSKLPPKVWNIVVLGEINRGSQIVKEESLVNAMEKRFSRQFQKDPQLKEMDLKALKG